MFQILRGDIIDANTTAICHQVNCRNVTGAGVAKVLYTKYPEVKSEYHKLCSTVLKPEELLGKIQIISINGEKAIVNIFGQLNYGYCNSEVYTSYDALIKAFEKINRVFAAKTIAFPYGFGCGLAGGDWVTVEKLLLKYLWNCDVKIYMKE